MAGQGTLTLLTRLVVNKKLIDHQQLFCRWSIKNRSCLQKKIMKTGTTWVKGEQ